jgi:NAD(P)-dependent dehydrogenase (short-subunit alcohol dehydrogenase family)
MAADSKVVLITGCSTGIGKATALQLARRGWIVYATARRRTDVSDLAAIGCRTLALDVTDEASMVAAVGTIEEAEGGVGVLVNNAGYSQSGAIESVPLERVRQQFETNVFGTVRMTQLVLPAMRRRRRGKIVNVGSMGGRLTFPGGGYYHATKYALEAITDALRFEVAGFGIDAILIEPGLIRTEFGESAGRSFEGWGGATDASDAYASFNEAIARTTREAYEGGPMSRLGGGPETVARTIERAIVAKKPKARYTVTPSANLLLTIRKLLPDRAWDAFVASQMPRPR